MFFYLFFYFFLLSESFVSEYCGEVVTKSEFEKRTMVYKKRGSKHFYFMALDSDTVIHENM